MSCRLDDKHAKPPSEEEEATPYPSHDKPLDGLVSIHLPSTTDHRLSKQDYNSLTTFGMD